jgi:D-amino-acid dehydrogenase
MKNEELDCRYQETGAMMVYRTPKGFAAGLDEAARLHAAGIPSQRLDLSETRGLAPTLSPSVLGAIFFPDDAHLVPDAFVRALARRAEERGVDIRTQTEVLGFRTIGRRILAIETTRGDLQADEVVLATGAWSPLLAQTLGLRLPVQPAKGYSVTYQRGSGGPSVPVILAEAKAGITPMGDWLRFAGTLELSGFDLSINRHRVEAIVRSAAQYVDGLDSLPLREIWCGLRPCTPDGLPIIGRPSSLDNLILATGHAMLGVTLGPITGSLVSQLAGGEKPQINLHALRPQRFE